MKLIAWNTAARARRAQDQVDALAARNPDIVALQEVTMRTAPLLRGALAASGLANALHSLDTVHDTNALRGPRRYGVLIASRFPLQRADSLPVPWPEKVLSVIVEWPAAPIELHTAHIPPGSSNGWIKIETLEDIYAGLAGAHADHPRILCGDFNTPQEERADGTVVTWGQRIRPDGSVWARRTIRGEPGARWDAAERSVLRGLADHDLPDVYRTLHGYGVRDFSWVLRRRGRTVRRRFDHVFASRSLEPRSCTYLHELRERGLSDHSPLEVVFRGAIRAS